MAATKKQNQLNCLVIVYSHTAAPRLQYIIQFLSDYFQHPFQLTNSLQEYTSSADFKINYSNKMIDAGEIHLRPHALLFETGIIALQPVCFKHNGYAAFFEAAGDIKFDLFAAIFFLLSRYEEYGPHDKDRFGLYAHHNSIAHKEGFLHLPLINIWLKDFQIVLEEKFAGIKIHKNIFSFVPTYDIDIAWAYTHRGVKKHLANIIRSFLKLEWETALKRIRTAQGKEPDPYDAFEWMDRLHQQYRLHPIYFFLVAAQRGRYDKNTNINVQPFQALIKTTSDKYQTGIHPSWYSGDNPNELPKEKSWLQNVIKKEVTISRQHYLRFTLPQTFQRLINVGIKDEYSMGYGSVNGFRASIASSFFWYDLEKEQTTSLLIHPFCFMDANSFHEQKYSPQQAFEELMHYYREVKNINGTMITLWHNNFLGTTPQLKGWRELYAAFIASICKEIEGS